MQRQGISKDLTQGNVVRQLIVFSLPFLLSSLVQSLYNVADIMIVGAFVGPDAISGVNIGGQVTFFLTNMVVGLATGGTVLIGQYQGAGETKKLSETIRTLITFLGLAAVLLTVIMMPLGGAFLRLLQTPAEAFSHALKYLEITVLGLLFIFGYNALSGIMRGMGDSKRPFYFVLIACLTNIALDLLLVGALGMGARGAAIATVISQAMSMFLCILYLRRRDFPFDFAPRSFRVNRDRLLEIVQIGTPTAVQNVVTSISFMVITAMINPLGVAASAGVAVVGKINGFGIMPVVAMSSSISAMTAQNIGAGHYDRVRRTLRTGLCVCVPLAVLVFLAMQLFPEPLIRLFGADEAMLLAGVTYIRTFSYDYLFISVLFCINGVITGAGHTTFALLNSMLSSILLRVPVSYLFGVALGWGLRGMGMGAPAASAGVLVIAAYYYLSGRWKQPVVSRRRVQPAVD